MTTTIFRYNFDNYFKTQLENFAQTYHNPYFYLFVENFNKWKILNNNLIKNEKVRLNNLGYVGNFNDKMFKSVRYYFKNKSNNKIIKKRKNYVKLNKEFLKIIDLCIDIYLKKDMKPELAHKQFVNDNIRNINNEYDRLNSLNEHEFCLKIKKTFKNRYYIKKNVLKKCK